MKDNKELVLALNTFYRKYKRITSDGVSTEILAWDDSFKSKLETKKLDLSTPIKYKHQIPALTDIISNYEQLLHEVDTIIPEQYDIIRKYCKNVVMGEIYEARSIQHRETDKFVTYSKKLYGSISSNLYKDALEIYNELDSHKNIDVDKVSSKQVASELQKRFDSYFKYNHVDVTLDKKMISLSDASENVVRVIDDYKFNPGYIDILECHEGWVHVGCNFNGDLQKGNKLLSAMQSRDILLQEGLATFTEFSLGIEIPERIKKIVTRILAITMGLNGYNFYEVYDFFIDSGCIKQDAFSSTVRIFQGGCLEGKIVNIRDISYYNGYTLVSKYINEHRKDPDFEIYFKLLFCGKLNLDDIPAIKFLYDKGIVVDPRYVPDKLYRRVIKIKK